MGPTPDTTYRAPVGSIDLPAEEYEIWPCHDCLPWHAEVIRDPDSDEVFVREWHAVECPQFVALLAEQQPES